MFEDATFHSSGIQPSQTSKWILVTLGFNLTVIAAMVILPLLYTDGLPTRLLQRVLYAPQAQSPAPVQNQFHASQPMATQILSLRDPLQAPRQTPTAISMQADLASSPTDGLGLDLSSSGNTGVAGSNGPATNLFQSHPAMVHPAPVEKMKLSLGVAEGLLIYKTTPIYPPIAKAAHISGTIVLAATISKTGTIENLRVVSGNPMLRQSALDAVQTWRYHPYLLNNQPVEVETTINVVFSFGSH